MAEAPPIAPRLLAWAKRNGRRGLPWQTQPRERGAQPRAARAYRVWISEIMLQQTRVATVIPYFERFLAAFPTLEALADAPTSEVLAHWSGLGYYARARNLQAAARRCRELHDGRLPQTLAQLMELPGIGRSTAGAILALGFGKRAAILDANARRVLARYYAETSSAALWRLAERETPQTDVAAYTQAIMDLGAGICTGGEPACGACPLAADCAARIAGTQQRFPRAAKSAARPWRHRRFLWIERDGLLLFQEREPAGIWGGLLCLPELPDGRDPADWCRERLGFLPIATGALPGFRHEFTHFRLRAEVSALRVAGERTGEGAGWRWMRPQAALAAALPSPIRRYLAAQLRAAEATLIPA